jgi:hypothetical protein
MLVEREFGNGGGAFAFRRRLPEGEQIWDVRKIREKLLRSLRSEVRLVPGLRQSRLRQWSVSRETAR